MAPEPYIKRNGKMVYPFRYMGIRQSGKIKDIGIWKEMPYGRVFSKLYANVNPQTDAQQTNRNFMAYGVAEWQGFADNTKLYYNKLKYPKSMSGFNRWLRMYLLGQS